MFRLSYQFALHYSGKRQGRGNGRTSPPLSHRQRPHLRQRRQHHLRTRASFLNPIVTQQVNHLLCPRILRRMSGVLEETGNPGNLVTLRVITRLLLPLG